MAHYFVVQELTSELSQSFSVTDEVGLRIGAVRPYLYAQGTVAGTFRMALFYNSVEIATTATFTASDMKTAAGFVNDYFAVNYYKAFTGAVGLPRGDYEIKLISSGYTYSTTDYIGWIIEHENARNAMSYTPANDSQRSFSFDLYGY